MILMTSLAAAASFLFQASVFRINQVGYEVGGPKIAVLLAPSDSVQLVDASGNAVWKGVPATAKMWDDADDSGSVVDFGEFRSPGTWRLQASGGTSWPVVIAPIPWESLVKGAVKGLWYNRCSYAIEGAEAGAWTRAAGHPDTSVRVHSSAVGPTRTTASRISAPGGWYDAGDYGKYLPSAAISTWSLLHLLRTFPAYFDTLKVGVPQGTGTGADLLDEALWSLRWMLSMQDPDDGGVYHRLTTAGFPGDKVVPASDKAFRYVSAKSTAAALGLAATAAKAHRVLAGRSPALADSCLHAAISAWNWARSNPKVLFLPDEINENFSPAIQAGPYSDRNVSDEFDWAAAELMLSTGQDSFAVAIELSNRIRVGVAATMIDWGDVRGLAALSLSLEQSAIPAASGSLGAAADSMLVRAARTIRNHRGSNGYHLPDATFKWSSNTIFANNGFVCWNAWRIARDTSFRSAAIDMLDYLLGRNATGYSFVTGFGALSPMQPHHRIANGDGVDLPIPGMLVGGPNPGQEDECSGYLSNAAAGSYVDSYCSYASNEPAINQSAALLLLAGALTAELSRGGVESARGLRRTGGLSVDVREGVLHARLPGGESFGLEVFGIDGRSIAQGFGRDGLAVLPVRAKGVLLVRVRAAGRVLQASTIVP